MQSAKWDLALNYYLESLEEFEDNEDKYNMAKTHNNIAEIYQAKGEWNKAIGSFSKAKLSPNKSFTVLAEASSHLAYGGKNLAKG